MFDSSITLVGNLVDDPKPRATSSGSDLTTFRMACTSRRFDRTHDRWTNGTTLFLRVACWRQLATNVAASVRKGDRVVVVGRLRQRSYDAQDGTRRTAYEVDADAVGVELAWTSVVVGRRPNRSAGTSAAPSGDTAETRQPSSASAGRPPGVDENGVIVLGAALSGDGFNDDDHKDDEENDQEDDDEEDDKDADFSGARPGTFLTSVPLPRAGDGLGTVAE